MGEGKEPTTDPKQGPSRTAENMPFDPSVLATTFKTMMDDVSEALSKSDQKEGAPEDGRHGPNNGECDLQSLLGQFAPLFQTFTPHTMQPGAGNKTQESDIPKPGHGEDAGNTKNENGDNATGADKDKSRRGDTPCGFPLDLQGLVNHFGPMVQQILQNTQSQQTCKEGGASADEPNREGEFPLDNLFSQYQQMMHAMNQREQQPAPETYNPEDTTKNETNAQEMNIEMTDTDKRDTVPDETMSGPTKELNVNSADLQPSEEYSGEIVTNVRFSSYCGVTLGRMEESKEGKN